ncbi:MAG TPA: DUF1015 family protein [Gammaproteobacteria bacterium]|nr:DUF1015 family protein [Gammaproteobacteria bacterium]
MSLIRPLRGLRPAPGRAPDVLAPPYDVVSSTEARRMADGHPWSFLHISKAEIDLPESQDPHSPEVYAKAAENFDALLSAGVLTRDPEPAYYVYRLRMGDHEQTGVVVAAAVAAYRENRIRRHEFTRPDKEDDRVRQIEALNAQTGPVLLAYPRAPEVDDLLQQVTLGAPEVDLEAADGVRHILWPMAEAGWCAQITRCFEAMRVLYIADGHHRSAAAERVARTRAAADPGHCGQASYDAFLAVAFPAHRMRILDYNRVVKDLNGLAPDDFLARLSERFSVAPAPDAVAPRRPGEFGLYLPGQWYRLTLPAACIPPQDPVARLDVSLLTDFLLTPVLGILDLRRDPRIDFVGGIRGLQELERRVNSGGMAAAFALRPTPMEALMAVADAGEVMPPKSTWFEPKLADGLVSHVLD